MTVGSAVKGTAKAAVGVVGAMGKEALGINPTSGNTPKTSNPSEEHHKKFPTEYKPSDKK